MFRLIRGWFNFGRCGILFVFGSINLVKCKEK